MHEVCKKGTEEFKILKMVQTKSEEEYQTETTQVLYSCLQEAKI